MTRGWQTAKKENERYLVNSQTGSFLYMAPEVVRSEPYNEKVGIYSCMQKYYNENKR